MQGSFIKRPFKSQQKVKSGQNIFQNQQQLHLPIIPTLSRTENEVYHFVGSQQLRDQILSQRQGELKYRTDSLQRLQDKQSLIDLSKSMQTTIKKQSVFSKLSNQERKQYTRQMRNLRYYKDYLQLWKKQSKNIRKFTEKGSQPTLLETSIKKLQVMPNPEKDDLIKNYVNSYWQMSLRNNNYILKRHIKGQNRYEQKQLQQLLQREQGRKKVESAIPKLPLQKLKDIDYKELSLSGRNKLVSESASCSPSLVSEFTSSRLTKAMTNGSNLDKNHEILKMNYNSTYKFMKDQSLYAINN